MNLMRALKTMLAVLVIGLVAGLASAAPAAPGVTPEEARLIAKEAYIYGFPLVDSYRIMYKTVADSAAPEPERLFNNLVNFDHVCTPEDRTVQTPNSDTPYSFLCMDLRTEPIVLTVPQIEKGRYFSIQLIDAYTFNFDYIGSRTTGNDGGSYLVVGPKWQGKVPQEIKKVLRAETEIAIAFYRTQLFNPGDLENVRKIQAAYKVQPLSAFLGQPAPKSAPPLSLVAPLTPEEEQTSLEFFNVLNFVLGFCPTQPSERSLLERFAKIGVGAGCTFAPDAVSPELKQAIQAGMADGVAESTRFITEQLATGKLKSSDLFGTREYLNNNYLYRCAGAITGIYGNSAEEAMYPAYRADADGQLLDGAKNGYVMRILPGQLPPVNAFWSLTMYELPSRLLSPNPLQRYLINSPMLPLLQRDADGGITLYIQHESPGRDKETNWLPAPNGPFFCVMRLYWPQETLLKGLWTSPVIKKARTE